MPAAVLAVETFLPSPAPSVAAHGASYYTMPVGGRVMSIHTLMSRSDTADVGYIRWSDDNGRTWGETVEWPTKFEHPLGTGRRHPRGGYVDPATGRYLTVWTEGVLPTDNPLEGMTHWTLHYTVSEDGGRTQSVNEQIIADGPEYDAVHHLPGITVGKNCAMMGDLGQRPLTRSDGVILLPIQSSPVGPDGEYFNPGAGYTYTDCQLLFGRWRPDGRLAWSASERIVGDPNRTTRGMIEPTIAELDGGRLLMVMRGSNDRHPEWPGYRWRAFSDDGGETWSLPEPWTYADGDAFFSPSSCSQLIPWVDGRLFWMGNISPANPTGNLPRYPIILGEVDLKSGLLIRESVSVIDDRRESDHERVTLSNFYAREDRETGHLLLHMNRLFANGPRPDGKPDWTADALLYRIAVG
ncbi:MAG: sialidase family protein [Armatimonadota bacterium]